MSYRVFQRPAQTGEWTTRDWSNWLVGADRLYIPVRPEQTAVCSVCRAPVGTRDDGEPWRRCFNCKKWAGTSIAGLVPISYSWAGGLESAIYRAKDDVSHRWLALPLASMLHTFLRSHLGCIERQYGTIDMITMLPSYADARGGWDHLRELHASVSGGWPADDRWNLDLLVKNHPTRAGERRGQADPTLFSVTADVRRKRVLLIDDTWTSGGSLYSAGAALRDADAWSSVALTLGRQFRVNDARFQAWQDDLTLGTEDDLTNTCAVHSSPDGGLAAFRPW